MDAGPIYMQEATEVASGETTGSLQAKLTPIGARLLRETLRRLQEGLLMPQEQDESAATFAPILKKEDGLIQWDQPAMMIERRVRGFEPWPGTYSHIGEKLLKIHRVNVVAADTKGSPGEVMRADAGGLWVATSSGFLGLEEVQLENRKRLSGVEFLRGARIKPGDRLQ
jgi:methionyl-tRNA formyltransferase